jgi:4-amino-4-deoxy-L-arabinose transferase-like glycosyltransferase
MTPNRFAAFRTRRWLHLLWLLALALYVLVGIPLVSFHGDEAMQIWMSHDYATAFIYGEPVRLMSAGPFNIDTEAQLRILNGSINRYGIGLGWHLAGFTNGDLPAAPGWDWGLDYDTNFATGHRPIDGVLYAGRFSSALFLALSVWVMFGLGWQLSGPRAAYLASGLYALNPVILLNGRRAMMEGSLLLFGLLVVLVAVIIARRQAQRQRVAWGWWLALALTGGLALASKHSGSVFVAGAFGWLLAAAIIGRRWRDLPPLLVRLTAAGAGVLALFIALSPALWYDPAARLQDLIRVRAELIDIQVQADPNAPMPLTQRLEFLVTQPFMTPAAHYEAGGWTDFSAIQAEIERYMNSPLSGVQFGPLIGGLLTLLALVGLLHLLRRDPASGAGLLVWLGLTVIMLLLNPLPWQRYYLPLIPIDTLLAALGLAALLARFVHRTEQSLTSAPLASAPVPPQTGK